MLSMTRLPRKIKAAQNLGWRPLNQSSRVSLISRIPTATKLVRRCLSQSAEANQNVRVDAQTSIATILEFPTEKDESLPSLQHKGKAHCMRIYRNFLCHQLCR